MLKRKNSFQAHFTYICHTTSQTKAQNATKHYYSIKQSKRFHCMCNFIKAGVYKYIYKFRNLVPILPLGMVDLSSVNPAAIWRHWLSTLSLPSHYNNTQTLVFFFTMLLPFPPKGGISSLFPVVSSGAANFDTFLQNYEKPFSWGSVDQNRRSYLAWKQWFSLSEVVVGRRESPVCRLLKSNSSSWTAAETSSMVTGPLLTQKGLSEWQPNALSIFTDQRARPGTQGGVFCTGRQSGWKWSLTERKHKPTSHRLED